MYTCRTPLCVAIALGGAALPCSSALAADPVFRNPTFEELANATVTSVTHAPLPQFTTPASVYIMTAEEVRASGSRTIPDALRFAPGMQVSQFDSHTWAIAARGFASLFVDKLLVLVDGRSVYTPLWSGVYWEQHEWLDPDLERIEVIRGPGGSAWGANAVNGVVNIVTRPARDTQGLALEVGAGTEEQAFGSVRYGGDAGADAHYRVYADYKERDHTELRDGSDAGDAWSLQRAGARYERENERGRFMMKGEAYSGDFAEPSFLPSPNPPFAARPRPGMSSGGYVQTEWSARLAGAAELRVNSWWESYERRLRPSNEESQTFNVDLQYRAALANHRLTSRVGYRRVDHEGVADFVFALDPAHRSVDVWSASVQDEIAVTPRVSLTAGVRAEHNDFVGWEWQPNLRASWRASDTQTWWAAIGRAVRTPSLSNEGGLITLSVLPAGALGPGSLPTIQQVIGNPAVASEEVTSSELGWRVQWAQQVSLGVVGFYKDYDQLIIYINQPIDVVSDAPDFWRIPILPVNGGSGRAYGLEASLLWQLTPDWRLDAEVTLLELQLEPAADLYQMQLNGSSPGRQASLRTDYRLGGNWQLGAAVRYASKLESFDVPSYVGADLRLARRWGEGVEVAIVGRDLWSDRHAEFRSLSYNIDGFVERSVFVTLALRM